MECNLRAKELFPPYCLSENWKIGIYCIFLFNHFRWWFINKDTIFVHLSLCLHLLILIIFTLCLHHSHTLFVYIYTKIAQKYKNLVTLWAKVWYWREALHCFHMQSWEVKILCFIVKQSVILNYWIICLRPTEVVIRTEELVISVLDF